MPSSGAQRAVSKVLTSSTLAGVMEEILAARLLPKLSLRSLQALAGATRALRAFITVQGAETVQVCWAQL